MRQTAAQLKLFFGGFGIPAYARSDIPDEVDLPYIAYELVEPTWDVQANMSCQIYYPKGMLEELLTKADEVAAAIGHGIEITLTNGYLMLYRSAQNEKQNDEWSESIYIPLLINAYHLPGE